MAATEDRRPSTVIIDLVARADDVDPITLKPLYNVIDPDVLDTICDSRSGFQELTFTYEGRSITVEAVDDGIEITLGEATYSDAEAAGIADAESSL